MPAVDAATGPWAASLGGLGALRRIGPQGRREGPDWPEAPRAEALTDRRGPPDRGPAPAPSRRAGRTGACRVGKPLRMR